MVRSHCANQSRLLVKIWEMRILALAFATAVVFSLVEIAEQLYMSVSNLK